MADDVKWHDPVSIVRRATWRARSLGVIQDGDVGQVPVLLDVIETVADDKRVLDREADVVERYFDLPPRRLAEEAGGAKTAG